eukprot:TRINITY_DN80013_c0_g1_i1.p1 TRINITY_DN80013_c0_g1~~TRINITY_DN80013_c0_g1_i1.p1  ORF type:complete len:303 (+),score=45.58 TRINITY_DN80013_c0_g1_i1:76-909(+)
MLKLFLLLAFATRAATVQEGTWMKGSGPILEGRLELKQKSAWHIGGFCFRHTADANNPLAGSVDIKLGLQGQAALKPGRLFIASFDARETIWGKVKDNWATSSCDEKLGSTNWKRDLFDYNMTATSDGRHSIVFTGDILQHTDTRDWHFAFMTCGPLDGVSAVTYEIHAVEGALSVFQADHMDRESCPILPSDWFREGRNHGEFWLMIFATICISCLPCCAVSICFYMRARRLQDQAKTGLAGAGSMVADVVGRPVRDESNISLEVVGTPSTPSSKV